MTGMTRAIDRTTFVGSLAVFLTLGFFVFIGLLFVLKIPEENRDLITAAAGILFTGTTMAWGYYLKSEPTPPQEIKK